MKLSERIRFHQDYEPPLQTSEVLLRDTCGQWADEVALLEERLVKEIESRDGWRDAWAKSQEEREKILPKWIKELED